MKPSYLLKNAPVLLTLRISPLRSGLRTKLEAQNFHGRESSSYKVGYGAVSIFIKPPVFNKTAAGS